MVKDGLVMGIGCLVGSNADMAQQGDFQLVLNIWQD
jgi:hypothetical protein